MTEQPQTAVFVELGRLIKAATASGPTWSHESTDLDITLLTWAAGDAISAHINDEVDVLLIGIAGTGEVTVNGEVSTLGSGHILLIPKHAERSLRCTEEHWNYLSVHQRRHGLWPTVGSWNPTT